MQPAFGGLAPRAVLLSLLLPAGALPAEAFLGSHDCSSIAKDFSRSAARLNRKHVAVVPFRDTSGKESRSGAVVAERLVAALLERGGVEVVERSQLEAVMEELRLASVGVVDPASVKRLGRFLGVDAIVTGTTVDLVGSQVEIHARLIDVETARVLAASTGKIEKDWSDFETSAIWAVSAPPVPFFPGDRSTVEWHDSLNAAPAPTCDTADPKVVDARARYWAIRLKDPGFSPSSLTGNPGSEIGDPKLRERFYSRVRMWYGEDAIPPLSETERTLVARCR